MDKTEAYLFSRLKGKRLRHTEGVVKRALVLAEIHGVSAEKARTAALLHDSAKYLDREELLAVAEGNGLITSGIEKEYPALLHGPAASSLIQRDLGIVDEDIINAVRYHTTGRPGMSLLEKIIYIADMTEENRDYEGVAELRKMSEENLDRSVYEGLQDTIRYVLRKNQYLHPLSVEARNELLLKLKPEETGI